MNNFNFGDVLTRAWQIIWKHKILWIFGFLASCGQSGPNFRSSSNYQTSTPLNPPPQVAQWLNWIENHLTSFLAIIFTVVCVIWIVTIFLSTIGKIGLIRGAAQADDGAEKLIFGQLFSESMPYFWRMFGLSLILAIPVFLFVIALVVGMLAFLIPVSQSNGSGAFGALALVPLLIGCVCLLIPVMFVLNMIFSQAERAIVLEELGVMPAISRGWEIVKNNLVPILLMAILLGVIGFVVGLVIVLPILIIVVPAAFAFTFGNFQNAATLIFATICFCLYLPVLWGLGGILNSYVETVWTLTYLRLTGKSGGASSFEPVTVTPPEPVLPADSNKTILSTGSQDSNQTLVASDLKDDNKTVIAKKPDA